MKKLFLILCLVLSTSYLSADTIVLSAESTALFKAKFTELMQTTMEYCIDSDQCRAKTGEILILLSQEIGRPLTGDEIDKLMERYDQWARNLVAPYNALTKELNFNLVISDTELILNGQYPQ